MKMKLRQWLETNGLPTDATTPTAYGFYNHLMARGLRYSGSDADGVADGLGAGDMEAAPDAVDGSDVHGAGDSADVQGAGDRKAAPCALNADENERLEAIEMYIRKYPECAVMRSELISDVSYKGNTLRKAIADFVSASSERVPGSASLAQPRWQHGDKDAVEKRNAAIVDGLLIRSGLLPARRNEAGTPVAAERFADGASNFAGQSLLRIGEELLRAQGVDTRKLSDNEIAQRMLRASPQTMHDFPLLMGSVLDRTLISVAAYIDRDWLSCVKEVASKDFRTRNALQFGGANKFGLRLENGQFPYASFSESGEQYTPHIIGLSTSLTLEMIIHDDLSTAVTQRQHMMYAQAESEREQFFQQLTSTSVMSDGNQLFGAAHGNVSTVDMTRGDLDSIRAALKAMRIRMASQTSPSGMRVNAKPKTILCSVEDVDELYGIASEARLSTAATPLGLANLNYGINVISSAEVGLYFYAFGDPNMYPSIEACWYLGNKEGTTYSEPSYTGLEVNYTTWCGFGIGRVGWHVDRTAVVVAP